MSFWLGGFRLSKWPCRFQALAPYIFVHLCRTRTISTHLVCTPTLFHRAQSAIKNF